jgi:hypothetical protein
VRFSRRNTDCRERPARWFADPADFHELLDRLF